MQILTAKLPDGRRCPLTIGGGVVVRIKNNVGYVSYREVIDDQLRWEYRLRWEMPSLLVRAENEAPIEDKIRMRDDGCIRASQKITLHKGIVEHRG